MTADGIINTLPFKQDKKYLMRDFKDMARRYFKENDIGIGVTNGSMPAVFDYFTRFYELRVTIDKHDRQKVKLKLKSL